MILVASESLIPEVAKSFTNGNANGGIGHTVPTSIITAANAQSLSIGEVSGGILYMAGGGGGGNRSPGGTCGASGTGGSGVVIIRYKYQN